MNIWVLVVAAYAQFYGSGYTATTFGEFSSQERCEAARVGITKWSDGSKYLYVACYPK